MWTRFCLRVLSASVFLKPLAEASSPWRNTIPPANSSTPSNAFFSHPGGASAAAGSVTWATSEVALYTSAHQSTRGSTSRWPAPGDAHTAVSIGRGQAVDSATAVWCSRGGDTGPCSLPAAPQPITAASPPASQSDSATPPAATNGRGEIFAETAAQDEGAAAASASPALSITPADPAITPTHAGGPRPDSHAATLQYTLPALPPSISPVLPVTPGGPTLAGSSLGLAFPSANSSVAASLSSAVSSSSPTESSAEQSPPQTPAPLSVASTATPPRFASASTVKSTAETSSADGSEPSSSLTAPGTFSFAPHASAVSSNIPGNGVAAPLANSSASSTTSNFTLAAASTFVISPSMALSFGSNTALSPSFPTAFTSGASPSGPSLSPSVPTLSPSMPDNTILPTPTDAFSPDSSSIFVCGGSPFQPSDYTCYDDSTLCPVQGGGRLEACGGSCYDPGLYGCVDDGLQPIVGGKLPNGVTPSHTIAVPATEWPSSVPTPLPSTASRTSSQPSSTTSRPSSSTLSTSTTSSSSSTSPSSSSTSSSASSSSSASATASPSSTAAPAPSDDSDNLSSNQIAAIAASTSSAFLLFAVAGLLLYRRHQRNHANPAPQQYPELAYLYDPPVPGSGNASRGGGLEGGPTGPFGVGGPGGGGAGAGSAAAWSGATISALGATLRGGGGSNSTNSSGSSVSLVGPAGKPPVMGAAGAAASASVGSGSGSSNAALLAASSTGGRGTPTRGAGDGNTMAPSPSRADESGDEGRPFLTAGGAVAGSSGASSRERSMERGTSAGEQQQQRSEGTSTWDEIDAELGARLHEKQVEETRQRRELARAFLLQAKERQEQRIPLLTRGDAPGASGAGAGAGVGPAAAAASRGRPQPQPHQSPSQRQQQWWQTSSPPTSPPPAPPSPPAAAHQTAATPAYHPIYPPISPTYPVSGPILTSQHIEHNRLQQAQHARAASRTSTSPPASPVNGPTTYPSFHRPRPSYPPPSPHWSTSREGAYAQLSGNNNSPPPFQQTTAYAPPHHHNRNVSNGLSLATAAGGVYTTIPEEPSHAPQGGGRGRQQSLHQIMQHMNALDEEDSDDDGAASSESGRFLRAPRRVLSVRNGAVTPSDDGGSWDGDGDEGGVEERRRWAEDGGRRNLI